MPLYIKIFLFLLLLIFNAYGQNTNETVADIGGDKISAREYKLRYEMMPKMSEASFNIDTLKQEFLYSLIAEKLWAKEAELKGLDNDEYFRKSFLQLEKLLLKDALFKDQIESKIQISSSELEKGINRSRFTLKLQIWSGPDSSDSHRIHDLIIKGLSFDSLNIPVIEITYGDMDDNAIEDLLYSLKPGEYSDPVKFKEGWFIFHLKDKILSTKDDDEKILNNVRTKIKERKARQIGTKFMSALMKDVKADADTALFRELALKITEELKVKTPDEFEKKEQTLFLSEGSVKKISEDFEVDKLTSVFVRINGKKFSLDDFLSFMKLDILSVRSARPNPVMQRLKNKIDLFIEQEILTEEAVRRNLHLSKDYQEEISLWKENYLAQLIRTKYLTALDVTDMEAYDFYLELSNKVDSAAQINIVEILSSDLRVIETVLDEISNGKDIRELARLYTEREWTREKGGEFGMFPVTMFKEISEAAVNMQPGEIYGPLKLQEGYSIFMLLDKKDAVRKFNQDFDEVKDQLRNDLKLKKYKDVVEEETVKLAEKYQVKVNQDLLEKIPVTQIQMFTYRYIGFGGRISAVPFTTPWHQWRKKIDLKNL